MYLYAGLYYTVENEHMHAWVYVESGARALKGGVWSVPVRGLFTDLLYTFRTNIAG